MLHYNKELKQFSRQLRQEMTDAEKLLWSKIRGKQLKMEIFMRDKISPHPSLPKRGIREKSLVKRQIKEELLSRCIHKIV